MTNRGRTLKFTAVLVLTALALTGFTTRRGGSSHSHRSGGSGGGCSSSHQNHDSSSSTSGSRYGSDDDSYGSSGSTSGSRYGSTSGGSYNRRPTHHSTPSSSSTGSGRLQDGKVRLVSCATSTAPYATVEVTNPNRKTVRFSVSVDFLDASGLSVTQGSGEVKVPSKGKATTRVMVGGEGLVDSVDRCDLDPYALPVS